VTSPGDNWPGRKWDPLYATTGKTPHANDRSREFKVGDAFMAAVDAIAGDTVFLAVFCEELKAAVCNEKPVDTAREVVLKAHKKRAE
jgi:hypothetical protein